MIWQTDLKRLMRDPAAVAGWIGFCLCLAIAVLSGLSWYRAQAADHAAFLAQERFHDPKRLTSPSRIELPIALEPQPAMALSIGRSDIEPAAGFTSFFTREDTIFRNYQIGAPVVEAAGRLDAAFVAIWLAPLLLIGLGLSVLASDRDGGQLRLRVSATQREPTQLLVRSALRLMLVVTPLAVAVLAVGLATPAAPGKAASLLFWLSTAVTYLALWQGVILLASRFPYRQEVLGAGLFGLWALWLVVVPAVASATAQMLSPPPSRVALVADARATEAAARARTQQLYEAYLHDHPEFMSVNEIDVRMRNYAMMYRAVEEAVRPRLAAFNAARAEQRRIASAVSLLSPALYSHDLLSRAAGTSDADYAEFQAAAVAYHRNVQSRLLIDGLAGKKYALNSTTVADFDYPGPHEGSRHLGVLVMLAIALALMASGARKPGLGALLARP